MFRGGDVSFWRYDFGMLVLAMCLLYGYVFLLPLVFYVWLNKRGTPIVFMSTLCLLGYTMSILVPVSVRDHIDMLFHC